ncbi:MAG: Tetratricopeptide domain protein [Bacteroidota bacterium]|nr:Tetratricopeptide domain protein [Bacteroidota bacterium]
MREKLAIPKNVVKFLESKWMESCRGGTYDIFHQQLGHFVETELKSLSQSNVSQHYSNKASLPSVANLERICGHRYPNHISRGNNFLLPDLLSLFAWGHTYEETLNYVNRLAIHQPNETVQNSEKGYETTKQNQIVKKFKILDESYWSSLKKKCALMPNLIERYYTHLDMNQILPAIAAGKIVGPNDSFDVLNEANSVDIKTLSQIINSASNDTFSLIKILAEGGTGKSTFLYYIGFSQQKNFHVLSFDITNLPDTQTLIQHCDTLYSQIQKPFIFLIDDVAAVEKSIEITNFLNEIKEPLSEITSSITIVAERINRYKNRFGYNEIDKLFSGCIQTIQYTSPDFEKVFINIYEELQKNNLGLEDLKIKDACKGLFLNADITKLSEKTWSLLNFLNSNNLINYKFDWDDWNEFIGDNSRFKCLENLFVVVACFYQFGIKVNLDFQSSLLPDANRLIILQAIHQLGILDSPIQYSEDEDFLQLKHEYIATWYLNKPEHTSLVRNFFKKFLQEVSNPIAAKLLRKIRKTSSTVEFTQSCLGQEFTLAKYITIIDQYLVNEGIINEESSKMLNEKGMALVKLSQEAEAIDTFLLAIKKDPRNNNHSRDQLARLYLKSGKYQLALDQYIIIVYNDGFYALREIRKIIKLGIDLNIKLSYPKHILTYSQKIIENSITHGEAEILKAYRNFMADGDIESSFDLLKKANAASGKVASRYNHLANSIRLVQDKLAVKQYCFENAISMFTQVNGGIKNVKYVTDYAVFLYKLREFSKSNQLIRNLILTNKYDEKIASQIRNNFDRRIKNINMLFFKDFPHGGSFNDQRKFLRQQCLEASMLVNNQSHHKGIIYRHLIYQTVRHHSEDKHPDIYFNALLGIAKCYILHAKDNWNNFSERDNRIIGENIYDLILRKRGSLTQKEGTEMIKNLLEQRENKKSKKALDILNELLKKSEFQTPIYFRYRGNAYKDLGYLENALSNYQHSLSLCLSGDSSHNLNRLYVLSNLCNLICEWLEFKPNNTKVKLKDAEYYCSLIERLNESYRFLPEIKEKISQLRNMLNHDS